MNNTEHGHKVIKNEKSGYIPTIDTMNPIPPNSCVAGCIAYTGGEVKHHKDCTFYEGSMSQQLDQLQHPTITDEQLMQISKEWYNLNVHLTIMSADIPSFIAGYKQALSMMPQSEGWGDIDSIIEKFKDETGSSVFATHTFTNWLKSKYTLHSLPHQPTPKQ
jgi:hypothetical protein